MTDPSAPPQKIAIVLRDDLPSWQALNATAFLSGAVAGHRPDLLGDAYADGDGTAYLSTFGIPIMVYAAPGPLMGTLRERAGRRGLGTAVFNDEMFRTGNDVDDRAVVVAVAGATSCSPGSRSSARATPSTRASTARCCTLKSRASTSRGV